MREDTGVPADRQAGPEGNGATIPPAEGRPSGGILLVGTANRHKVREIRALLSGLQLPDGSPVRVVGGEILPPGDAIEETGATFEENAAT